MKRLINLFLFLLFITHPLLSQYYEPQSKIMFDESEINKSKIEKRISDVREFYTNLDIDQLRIDIKRNNNTVETNLLQIRNELSNLSIDKQELLQLVDVHKIEEQIREKEKNKEQIKQEIQNDLDNTAFKGLFAVVLKDIDIFKSKEELSKMAEEILTPVAVENLNGVFISGMTVVENNQVLLDVVKSRISGQMSINKQVLGKANYQSQHYVYVARVDVYPLKKRIGTSAHTYGGDDKHVIINLLSDGSYKTTLEKAQVSEEDIRSIAMEVETSSGVIQDANISSTKRQQYTLETGNRNIDSIDAEIAQLKSNLANRSTLLKTTIESKTDVRYTDGNMKESIKKAIAYFDGKLKELNDRLFEEKGKELLARYNANVTIEGTPQAALASSAYDVAGQMKQTYSKVEQFIRESDVANNTLQSDRSGQAHDAYREIDKIWLYPVPGSDNNFTLTMVAKFKISKDADKKSPKTIAKKREQDKKKVDNKTKNMVFVAGGTFLMGSNDGDPDERPIHKVYVDGFWIDKYEVTNAKYCEFLNEKGNQAEGGVTWLNIRNKDSKIVKEGGKFVPMNGYANHPVTAVNWFGAKAYAEWAGKRLPTEAEWEYASRGGKLSSGYKYSGSNVEKEVAWNSVSSGVTIRAVGQKKANELGIFDMSGNLWEWCQDWYDQDYYNKSPYENPPGPSNGEYRVVRGGSYSDTIRTKRGDSWIKENDTGRNANRFNQPPLSGFSGTGFRCVR